MKKKRVGLVLCLSAGLAVTATSGFAAKPGKPSQASHKEQTSQSAKSLYKQLGGEAAINAAVDLFYEKVLADSRVNGFFQGVDMNRQRAMQKAFLTFAFGGPNAYKGRDLRAAHAHLVARGLNDSHFDIIVGHLGATLKELGVKDELIAHAAKVANSVRGDILGKTAPAATPDQGAPVATPDYAPPQPGLVGENPKEVDPELANVWSVPYTRYSDEQLKKYPFYPSNIQFENNGVPFVAPSVFTCAGCHPQQYEDWQGSMHAQAFRDPIYLGELNLAVEAVGKGITKQCEGCHTAAAVVSGDLPKEYDFKKLSDLAKAGVSCDVCHSIKKHTHWETPSHEPENGSYVLSPGRKDEKTGKGIRTKYGPFANYEGCGGGFHECVESPLHLRAELCAGCHQVFHYKEHTPLEHTYSEWKRGMYAVNGIQCQDCHMVDIETFKRSADTFQKPKRSEYRHYFNGANFTMYFLEELRAKKMGDEKLAANAKKKFDMAVARLQAAADLEITPIYDAKGELSKIKVRVKNERCGHALPTSLTNIRQMWLEVLATDEKGKVEIRSGFIKKTGDKKGDLDENTYVFNSDGMDHHMKFAVDPWEIVSFSRHDIIPPKGYRDVYYTTLGDHRTHKVTFRAKLRWRAADQKVAAKLLTSQPKGFDLNEVYGLTEVPELPVVDMVEKTITFSTKGKPSSADH
jgi:truncated hemoglobin YjbI